MSDFTLDTYKNPLEILKQKKYSRQSPLDTAGVLTTFLSFVNYLNNTDAESPLEGGAGTSGMIAIMRSRCRPPLSECT